MPYLVGQDLPSEPAGARFRALIERGGILQLPGAHNGMAALQAKAAGFDALYLSGAAMTASMGLPDLGIITARRGVLLHPPDRACERLAVAGGRRHRLRRSAQRDEHGARLRGCRAPAPCISKTSCCRRSAAISTTRNWPMPTTWRTRSRRRRERGDISIIIARTDAAASEGIDGAVARAQALCQSRRRCDLPRGVDQPRDVRGIRQAHARRAAARQHDGVRPHAVLHRRRVRGDGLPHGDLAGLVAAGRQQGAGDALRRDQARWRHANCSTRCRRAPSSTS